MAEKSRKKKKSDIALRREIEALRAQLKEQGVEPVAKTETKKISQIDLKDIKKTKKESFKEDIEENISEPQSSSFLKKEMQKTVLLSVLIIISVIIIKIANLF